MIYRLLAIICLGSSFLTAGNFYLKTVDWSTDATIDIRQCTSVSTVPLPSIERHFTLHTATDVPVPVLFFDRNSDVLLIAGQGLPASKEVMKVYTELFTTYDVLLFDYRWCNNYGKSLLTSVLCARATQRILLDEEQEVRTVIDFAMRCRSYKKIVGLGECYSCFLFAKVQADDTVHVGKGPFTHLILDSCWHSYASFADSIAQDPFLPFNPTTGGAPWLIKKITNCPLLKWPLLKLLFWIIPNVSIEPYLQHISIPTLFVYGENDLFVRKPHFAALWQAAPAKYKVALRTPYAHASNLGNKTVYRFIAEQFIAANTINAFVKQIPLLRSFNSK